MVKTAIECIGMGAMVLAAANSVAAEEFGYDTVAEASMAMGTAAGALGAIGLATLYAGRQQMRRTFRAAAFEAQHFDAPENIPEYHPGRESFLDWKCQLEAQDPEQDRLPHTDETEY